MVVSKSDKLKNQLKKNLIEQLTAAENLLETLKLDKNSFNFNSQCKQRKIFVEQLTNLLALCAAIRGSYEDVLQHNSTSSCISFLEDSTNKLHNLRIELSQLLEATQILEIKKGNITKDTVHVLISKINNLLQQISAQELVARVNEIINSNVQFDNSLSDIFPSEMNGLPNQPSLINISSANKKSTLTETLTEGAARIIAGEVTHLMILDEDSRKNIQVICLELGLLLSPGSDSLIMLAEAVYEYSQPPSQNAVFILTNPIQTATLQLMTRASLIPKEELKSFANLLLEFEGGTTTKKQLAKIVGLPVNSPLIREKTLYIKSGMSLNKLNSTQIKEGILRVVAISTVVMEALKHPDLLNTILSELTLKKNHLSNNDTILRKSIW